MRRRNGSTMLWVFAGILYCVAPFSSVAHACSSRNWTFFFSSGSAEITPFLRSQIQSFTDASKKMPARCISIIAKASIDGEELKSGMVDLDSKRVNAIRSELVKNGLTVETFEIRLNGFTSPMVNTDRSEPLNRNVEFIRWLSPELRYEYVDAGGPCIPGCCPVRATLPDGQLCFDERHR